MKRLNLGPKVKFKKAKLPIKKKLFGKYIILEPLKVTKHSKELYFQYSKEKKNIIWTYLPYGSFKTYGSIEVGHINYSPLLQNSIEGTETMFLMMKNAFETLGNRRYEWKCNNLNSASKKAAIRLGFKFEGVFRQMFIFKGRSRDSAWFSIIDKEWKKLKAGYKNFLLPSNFINYKQIKKLKF